jgi:hypothetical protein
MQDALAAVNEKVEQTVLKLDNQQPFARQELFAGAHPIECVHVLVPDDEPSLVLLPGHAVQHRNISVKEDGDDTQCDSSEVHGSTSTAANTC